MNTVMSGSLRVSLLKRQRIVASCFFLSLLLLVFTVVYGLRGITATAFLVHEKAVSSQELLETIRFWFWAIVASITNYPVLFIAWFFSDRHLIDRLKQ